MNIHVFVSPNAVTDRTYFRQILSFAKQGQSFRTACWETHSVCFRVICLLELIFCSDCYDNCFWEIIEIFLKECMFKLKHISKSKSLPRNTWQLALPRKNIVYCALNSSLQDFKTLIFYRVYDAIDYVDWFELSCPWFHSAPSLHNFYIIIVNWPG